jgi:hypothetical protein
MDPRGNQRHSDYLRRIALVNLFLPLVLIFLTSAPVCGQTNTETASAPSTSVQNSNETSSHQNHQSLLKISSSIQELDQGISKNLSAIEQKLHSLEQAMLKQDKSIWHDFAIVYPPLFIALMGLGIAIWQARLNRSHFEGVMKHNEISVRPDITSSYRLGFIPGEPSGLFIENNGLGPGTIRSLELKFDDKPLKSPQELIAQCKEVGLGAYGLNIGFAAPGNSISPGREIGIICLDPEFFPKTEEESQRVSQTISKFRVILTYQDWYGNTYGA